MQAFDPLVVHVVERVLGRRSGTQSLSFGQSLDGTRDILIVTARDLIDLLAVVPAARALRKRFPLSRIHVLSSQACAEVLAPRPEIFESLLAMLGVAPAEAVHVGDNLDADVAGATAVGMRTVWITRCVPDPDAALARYTGPRPTWVVRDLAEIASLV